MLRNGWEYVTDGSGTEIVSIAILILARYSDARLAKETDPGVLDCRPRVRIQTKQRVCLNPACIFRRPKKRTQRAVVEREVRNRGSHRLSPIVMSSQPSAVTVAR